MGNMNGVINIPIKVDRDFELSIGALREKYGEGFEFLNGLHESQLNFSDFIDGFIDKNVADATIDSNANVSNKDIRSLISEKGKSEDKLFAFNKIFYDMKKIYGIKTSKAWLETEWSGGFYLHDASSSTEMPYCFSYDLTRLANEGLFFLKNYNHQAPKHLTTFVDDLIEYISYYCNRSSGAVGIANVLVWTYYFWKKDCAENYVLRNPEYYARQSFQKIIYRLNQPFLRIDQSSFTNVSIFDRNYLEALFGGMEYPDGSFVIDEIEGLIEHQKLFMEVVADIRSENMFTYPVLTYSLLKRNDITKEEAEEMIRTKNWNVFVDQEFARWCSDRNVDWNDSNFFMSDNVGTLSNCCFSGDTEVIVNFNGNGRHMTFEELYNEWINKQDARIEVVKVDKFLPARVIRLPRTKMYKVITSTTEIKATFNHLFPVLVENDKYMVDIQVKDLKPGDILTKNVGNSVYHDKVLSVEEIEYEDKYVYCFEMEDYADPYFTLANGILTHNCRLLSDTSKLDAFINSIGGTALSIGSEKVNTINLMRIALESGNDKKKYLEILRDRVTLCCKALDVIRHIIARNVQKGLLPNYGEGGVEMSKQYSTVGILGMYETIKEFGLTTTDEFGYTYYTEEGVDFACKIFRVINDVKDNFNEMKKSWIRVDTNEDQYKDLAVDYSFNCESVPGERAAVILCQKDNSLYDRNDNFIYSNQWIPLSTKCTIQEKLRVSAILDEKCSGGAIAHINLESNFPNKDAAWDMLNKIALSGVIYFAFNTKINECKNHHGFVGTDHCPVCGEAVYDTYQRIVGYLVPSRQYSKDRFKEFKARQWFNYAEELKDL